MAVSILTISPLEMPPSNRAASMACTHGCRHEYMKVHRHTSVHI
jgi:hypothetical protein